MITALSIKNYALIENITIDFEKGLTVITGETGAGKSIIIDSIDLLLGARASTSIIRTGTKSCTITAEFNISKNTNVKSILSDLSIDFEKEIIIRRQIDSSGKSKAFINDISVSINTLSNIGKYLVDFYAQHKSNMLFEQNYQKQIVDSIANNNSLLEKLSVKYDKYESLKKQKEEIEKANTDRERLLDLYKYQINEINKANLISDEEEKIEQELPKLKNAEKIKTVTGEMLSILYKQEHSVTDNLSIINKQVDLLEKYGINVENISKNLASSMSQIDDIYREVEDLSNSIDIAPEKLDSMLERQQLIKKLKSKYGKTLQEIIDYGKQLEDKVKNLENYEVNMDKLQKEINLILKEITSLCEQISDKRKKVSKSISKDIISELEDLNMKNSQFEIDIKKGEITRTGFDDLDFMFSANKGEKLYPLSLVASGGEISRVMLALSTTVSNNYNVDTVIFDEIDTGTSGKTGEKIGKKLKSLSKERQIISISHLAQIASNADNHIKIYKESENGRNITKAKVLNDKERVEEIAKIISGEKVTEHAIKHAEEMLSDN
ncbi:DNA repair protein RecN [Candidatus Ruminimicrobiellum ovillum]|uniref:DNA repair protein RecN n=1 Tax=Candidatus Ruminimicrobiellum ovillum TaxID=1947927 RepID=UPI00355A80F7